MALRGGQHASIPKVLHFTWRSSDLGPSARRNLNAWRRLNPDWAVRFYNDTEARRYVAGAFPQYLHAYDGLLFPVERADYFRYLVLLGIGGAYFDIDVAPAIMPLTSLMSSVGPALVLGWEGEVPLAACSSDEWGVQRQITNWALASAPGHPLLRRLADQIATRYAKKLFPHYRRDILSKTGPVALTQVVLTALAEGWHPTTPEGREQWPVLFLPQAVWGNKPRANHLPLQQADESALRSGTHQFAGTWKHNAFTEEEVKLRFDANARFGECEPLPLPVVPVTLPWAITAASSRKLSGNGSSRGHGAMAVLLPRGRNAAADTADGGGGGGDGGSPPPHPQQQEGKAVNGSEAGDASSPRLHGHQGQWQWQGQAPWQGQGQQGERVPKPYNPTRDQGQGQGPKPGQGQGQRQERRLTMFVSLLGEGAMDCGEDASTTIGHYGNMQVGLPPLMRPTVLDALLGVAAAAAHHLATSNGNAEGSGANHSSNGNSDGEGSGANHLSKLPMLAADLGAVYGQYSLGLAAAGYRVVTVDTAGAAWPALKRSVEYNDVSSQVMLRLLPRAVVAALHNGKWSATHELEKGLWSSGAAAAAAETNNSSGHDGGNSSSSGGGGQHGGQQQQQQRDLAGPELLSELRAARLVRVNDNGGWEGPLMRMLLQQALAGNHDSAQLPLAILWVGHEQRVPSSPSTAAECEDGGGGHCQPDSPAIDPHRREQKEKGWRSLLNAGDGGDTTQQQQQQQGQQHHSPLPPSTPPPETQPSTSGEAAASDREAAAASSHSSLMTTVSSLASLLASAADVDEPTHSAAFLREMESRLQLLRLAGYNFTLQPTVGCCAPGAKQWRSPWWPTASMSSSSSSSGAAPHPPPLRWCLVPSSSLRVSDLWRPAGDPTLLLPSTGAQLLFVSDALATSEAFQASLVEEEGPACDANQEDMQLLTAMQRNGLLRTGGMGGGGGGGDYIAGVVGQSDAEYWLGTGGSDDLGGGGSDGGSEYYDYLMSEYESKPWPKELPPLEQEQQEGGSADELAQGSAGGSMRSDEEEEEEEGSEEEEEEGSADESSHGEEGSANGSAPGGEETAGPPRPPSPPALHLQLHHQEQHHFKQQQQGSGARHPQQQQQQQQKREGAQEEQQQDRQQIHQQA